MKIYDKGLTLFLTLAYPPNPAASSIVHTHLLSQFDPNSFIIITGFFIGAKKAEVPLDVNRHYVYISFEFISSRVHRFLQRLQKYTLPLLLRFYIRKYNPARIIITYPDLYWLDVCTRVSEKFKIPFIPYLHDTIFEGANNFKERRLAQKVQQRIFNKAYKIAVMSEGMKLLYKNKYKIKTDAWQHIFPEESLQFPGSSIERAHWSGDVYKINNNAVARFSRAFSKLNMQVTISNGKTRDQLPFFCITGNHISKVYYPTRNEYLYHLNSSKLLLLGLNYPDECETHEDELATIFSTKTPEYLASNALIIYHGPSHYFLAKFISDNKCGIIIDTRDESEILLKLSQILENYESYRPLINKAKECLGLFNPEAISEKVRLTLK